MSGDLINCLFVKSYTSFNNNFFKSILIIFNLIYNISAANADVLDILLFILQMITSGV
jgi:hypothetical protein